MNIIKKIDEFLNEEKKKCKGCKKMVEEDKLTDGYCDDCYEDDDDNEDEDED